MHIQRRSPVACTIFIACCRWHCRRRKMKTCRILGSKWPIYYTMLTNLTRNALILSGGRGYRPGRRRRRTRHLPPPRTHAPVTNLRRGRRTRQLFSGRGGCARGQMSASVSHKYSSSSEERASLSIWTPAVSRVSGSTCSGQFGSVSVLWTGLSVSKMTAVSLSAVVFGAAFGQLYIEWQWRNFNASWLSPPSCEQNSRKRISLWLRWNTLCWQDSDHSDIFTNQRIECYLNNTITVRTLTPCYTHKMAIVSWP